MLNGNVSSMLHAIVKMIGKKHSCECNTFFYPLVSEMETPFPHWFVDVFYGCLTIIIKSS